MSNFFVSKQLTWFKWWTIALSNLQALSLGDRPLQFQTVYRKIGVGSASRNRAYSTRQTLTSSNAYLESYNRQLKLLKWLLTGLITRFVEQIRYRGLTEIQGKRNYFTCYRWFRSAIAKVLTLTLTLTLDYSGPWLYRTLAAGRHRYYAYLFAKPFGIKVVYLQGSRLGDSKGLLFIT